MSTEYHRQPRRQPSRAHVVAEARKQEQHSRRLMRLSLGVLGATGLLIGVEASGSDVPGTYLVSSIQSGQIKVSATPHTVFLMPGTELLTTPFVTTDSSVPINLDEKVPKGNVAVLSEVGKVTINNTEWLVGTHDERIVFADVSDLEHKQAVSGKTLVAEYAPKSFDFDDQAVVRDGQLFQPSNNYPVGAVSLIPADDLASYIEGHNLKTVEVT